MPNDEQILVIPSSFLFEIGEINGFSHEIDKFLTPILASDQLCFKPRSQMETDPSFKQLIPYVILQHIDDTGTTRIFTYTRGSGHGERRLHTKKSIGIGGHINKQDVDYGNHPYFEGMERELDEEVKIGAAYVNKQVGLIYDPSNEVGRVHLGIVHILKLSDQNVLPNEDDISESGFLTIGELRENHEQLETWSQICLDSIYKAS